MFLKIMFLNFLKKKWCNNPKINPSIINTGTESTKINETPPPPTGTIGIKTIVNSPLNNMILVLDLSLIIILSFKTSQVLPHEVLG